MVHDLSNYTKYPNHHRWVTDGSKLNVYSNVGELKEGDVIVLPRPYGDRLEVVSVDEVNDEISKELYNGLISNETVFYILTVKRDTEI